MKDGIIQQVGTPQEVFNAPVNLFVAGFIGMPQMNFYQGELIKQGNEYSVKLEDAVIPLSEEKNRNLLKNNVESKNVTIGVRPEHIVLDNQPGRMIKGVVDVSEMMGSSVHLHIQTCGKDSIIIVPTLELKNSDVFDAGHEIEFTFNNTVIHLFDNETGKNLEY